MLPYLVDFGFIKIPTYGVMIASAYIVSYYYLLKRARDYKINEKEVSDIVFYTIVFGFIGAKIFYIITFFNYFGTNFKTRIINTFSLDNIRAGFVFYGGFIFATVFVYLYSKKKKLDFLKIGDFLAPAIALAHSIGRIGCFSAGCCHGAPTQSIFGVRFTNPMCDVSPELIGVKIHPTQLYESVGNFAIFLILNYVSKKNTQRNGFVLFLYFMSYSILRFIVEFFRGDDRGSKILGFSQAQFISIIVFLISIYFIFKYGKEKNNI